ncbi:MAG: non-homologous end-joining DNA ligase [Verrucomicrobiota bacterium]|nr:non-homologous end-joining DNA ligase [Verrucomicrobiota bacterium]
MGIESRGEKKEAVKRKAFSLPKDLPSGKARFIAPMKAKLFDEPPTQGDWSYELKFDGIRLIAVKNKSKVNLISRNRNELSARFPEVADAIASLPTENCMIDGEVVAVDDKGRSSFQLLQGRDLPGGKDHPVYFYAFDLLQANDQLLIHQPLEKRKAWLQQLCANGDKTIRYSGEIEGEVSKLLQEVQRLGLEGLIGKLRNSVYEPDRRSGAWIKLKVLNEQEFVIGGYTPPAGARKHFGALLVGYYKGDRLLFAGKIGTGFNAESLALLHGKFRKESRANCPFADLPSRQGGAWVQGITPSMMRKMHWVNPVFVCQIKFAEWTRNAKLRQPVFLGLREDKKPTEVKRETPQ